METGRSFISNPLQLFFISIKQYEGPRKKKNMKWNGTHTFLFYADNNSLMDKTENNIKGNTEVILGDSNNVGRKLIAEKTKYMFMLRQHNLGWICNTNIA